MAAGVQFGQQGTRRTRWMARWRARGGKLFLKLQCISCHSADADRPQAAGAWKGCTAARVPLRGGGAEIADEQYIRESIRKPRVKVVEGWEPIMPDYDQGQVTAEDMSTRWSRTFAVLKPGDDARPDRAVPRAGSGRRPSARASAIAVAGRKMTP